MKGFDSAQPVAGIIPKIKAAGCGFAGRYYSRNTRKNLSPQEAKALSVAGIAIVTVWEAAGDQLGTFTAVNGARDADAALACAELVGQPEGTTIFFAVDLDVSAQSLIDRVMPYFAAIGASFADKYQAGVYGSGLVCSGLKARHLVTHTWLGGAMGWSGSRNYNDWNIRQGLPSDPYGFGFQIDPDEAQGDDYGQWTLSTTAPATAPSMPPVTLAEIIEVARLLQTKLGILGYYQGAIDGAIGPASSAAAMRAYNDWKGDQDA